MQVKKPQRLRVEKHLLYRDIVGWIMDGRTAAQVASQANFLARRKKLPKQDAPALKARDVNEFITNRLAEVVRKTRSLPLIHENDPNSVAAVALVEYHEEKIRSWIERAERAMDMTERAQDWDYLISIISSAKDLLELKLRVDGKLGVEKGQHGQAPSFNLFQNLIGVPHNGPIQEAKESRETPYINGPVEET